MPALASQSAEPQDVLRGVKRPPLTPTLSNPDPGPSPKISKTNGILSGHTRDVSGKADNTGSSRSKSAVKSKENGTSSSSSPNFANIYGFFAKMFDPHSEFDAITGVKEASMSPLDKEVVKLLMSNLEFNIANTAFRQQLLETYRQQLQQSVQQTVS